MIPTLPYPQFGSLPLANHKNDHKDPTIYASSFHHLFCSRSRSRQEKTDLGLVFGLRPLCCNQEIAELISSENQLAQLC